MQPVFTGHLSAFDLHTLDLGEAQIRVGHLWDAKWNRRRKRRFLFTIFLQPRFYSVSTRAISSKQNKLPHLSLQNCFLLFVAMIPVPRNSWCFFFIRVSSEKMWQWVLLGYFTEFFFYVFFFLENGPRPFSPVSFVLWKTRRVRQGVPRRRTLCKYANETVLPFFRYVICMHTNDPPQ